MITEEKPIDVFRARSQKVCDQFKEIGLMAVVPAHPPLGSNVFSMGLDSSGEVFRFWTGGADVEIIDITAEPKKQAVVRISEQKHDVEIPLKVYGSSNQSKFDAPRNYMTTNFPGGTTFKFKGKWKFTPTTRDKEWGNWTNKVIATVPSFDDTFLMGYDEVKCFISQLPKHVGKVEDAHKVLRPVNILKTSVRQGEWFFTPCSKAEIATIEKEIASLDRKTKNLQKKRNRRYINEAWRWRTAPDNQALAEYYKATNSAIRYSTPIIQNSSHRALQHINLDGTTYVKGSISDNRAGRHAPLSLETWHRVTRNNEVIQTDRGVELANRNWD